jgi:CheY-like chemotaxis protein
MGSLEKIMVVDDEMGICQNVEKILKKKNYEVTTAVSAEEAMEKMGREAYSLLISDIVMPGGKNGLELLKMVKDQWPLTKVVMMTAYASTDTAVKAIRLGALDYLPKPFTPDELRSTVDQALAGELSEAPVSNEERELIDIDIPFDADEVAKYTGEEYAKTLGPSDIPFVEPAPETLKNYCMVGEMVCEIFEKLGNTCKGGVKSKECPQKKAKMKKGVKKGKGFDAKKLIGIDQPFNYEEVISVTGPEYVQQML